MPASDSRLVGLELDLDGPTAIVVAYRFACGHRAPSMLARPYSPSAPKPICIDCASPSRTVADVSTDLQVDRMLRVITTAARNEHRRTALAEALLLVRDLLDGHPVPRTDEEVSRLMARRDALALALHRTGAMYWPVDRDTEAEEEADRGISR